MYMYLITKVLHCKISLFFFFLFTIIKQKQTYSGLINSIMIQHAVGVKMLLTNSLCYLFFIFYSSHLIQRLADQSLYQESFLLIKTLISRNVE